jgi:hypothetical protein
MEVFEPSVGENPSSLTGRTGSGLSRHVLSWSDPVRERLCPGECPTGGGPGRPCVGKGSQAKGCPVMFSGWQGLKAGWE